MSHVQSFGRPLEWTPEEDRLLSRTSSVDDYNIEAHHNGLPQRTYDSWRKRRKRVGTPPPPPPVETGFRPKPTNDDEWEDLFSLIEGVADGRGATTKGEESTWFSLNEPVVAVAFVGDIHAGQDGVDYQQFKRDMLTIADTDGLYAVGMGDYMENVKPSLKAQTAMYTTIMKPSEQLEYCKRRMGVADGKWIAILSGNHDQWDYKVAGIDRIPDLADHLNAPYFTERGGSIFIELGDRTYHVVVKHDYTGKSRITKSNSARRLFLEWPHEWESADVVCLAHLHEPDLHMPIMKGRPVAWLRTGTYKVRDSYAEAGGFKPAYGVPVVLFYRDERKIIPFSGPLFQDAIHFLAAERERLDDAL